MRTVTRKSKMKWNKKKMDKKHFVKGTDIATIRKTKQNKQKEQK